MSSESPFVQAMNQAKTAAEDFTKMFSDLRLPAMPGAEALMNAHRRNLEAFSAAYRISLEGTQALGRRNMEIYQQSMAEMTDILRAFTTLESPQERAARQTELLKSAYERAVANMREVGELIQRANGEAVEMLNKRFTEAMDEVKLLVSKSGKAE